MGRPPREPAHRGTYVQGAEYGTVWECAADCPHPEHDLYDPEDD